MRFSLVRFSIVLVIVGSLSACGHFLNAPDSVGLKAPDQTNVCEVNQWQRNFTAAACKVGQKVAFIPASLADEQAPILFASVNCDLRYTVALSKAGATCIYAGPLGPHPTAKAEAGTSQKAPAKSTSTSPAKS